MESYRARLQFFADEVSTWISNGAECLVISDQPHRVKEICAELKLSAEYRVLSTESDGVTNEGPSTSTITTATTQRPNDPTTEHDNHQPSTIKHQQLFILEGRLRQGFKFADI